MVTNGACLTVISAVKMVNWILFPQCGIFKDDPDLFGGTTLAFSPRTASTLHHPVALIKDSNSIPRNDVPLLKSQIWKLGFPEVAGAFRQPLLLASVVPQIFVLGS